MPSALEETLARHRRRLIEREEAAFRELLEAYSIVERELRRQIRELLRKMREARDAGTEISPSWFYRERRLRSLIDQVKSEIIRFGETAARVTTAEQAAAIRFSLEEMSDIVRVQLGTSGADRLGMLLPTRTIETAVGLMGDGSPILEYYSANLAPKVAEMIRVEVIKAASIGTDFRTISNRLLQTGQITRTRALMVARTEVNRVRRAATLERYRDNSDIITGWEWVSSKSIRTCPACLWMDGQIFKLGDAFPQHPNCRCTMIPVIIGIEKRQRTIGRDWFEKLSDADKEKILGRDAFAGMQRGELDLKDLVGWKNSKEFGRSIYTKSVVSVLR